MTNFDLEKFLYAQIPLAQYLGAKIQSVDKTSAVVVAPLIPNRNHMGTAFGGSLQALLILAAYAWLYKIMKDSDRTCHLILQACEMKFIKPVTEREIRAICYSAKDTALKSFFSTFDKKGLARLELKASVGKECNFVGKFVAQQSDTDNLN